jgi:glycosyltransferase involved in cell wall biosynthesis
MTRLFINAAAASAGGGLTYVRNLIPHLKRRREITTTLLLRPELREEFVESTNLKFLEFPASQSGSRFWSEQKVLPELIHNSGSNVLLSAGNFALWNSPVPQILLSRNALYVSRDFYRDLLHRGDVRLWLDTRLKAWFAKDSIRRSHCTIAPSQAFSSELSRWSKKPVSSLYHGFDLEEFFNSRVSLPAGVQRQLEAERGCIKLLFVSHYNYYRNFETLLRALPIIKASLAPRRIKLLLTCKLEPGTRCGAYSPKRAFLLASRLGLQNSIVELGAVPYRALHRLYRQCDVYVTPAYAESFAHPLVEAMASGVPIVASDIPVHREICGASAIYFERFSPQALADRVMEMIDSPSLARQQRESGSERVQNFNWQAHLDALLEHTERLL